MDAEITALFANAATALVGKMAEDGWEAGKAIVAAFFGRLFGHGDDQHRALIEELDASALQITHATEQRRSEVRGNLQTSWQTRLSDLLKEQPHAAAELRLLIAQLDGNAPLKPSSFAAIHTSGDVNNQSGGLAITGIVHGNVNGSGS